MSDTRDGWGLHFQERTWRVVGAQNPAFEKTLDFGPQFILNLKLLLIAILIPQRIKVAEGIG